MVPAVPRACPAGRVIRCIRREIVRHRSRWARTGLTTRGPIPCGLRVRCLSLTIVEGHRLPVVVVRSLSVVGTKPDVNETTISPPTTHDEPVRWVVYVSLSAGLRYHRHTRSPSCFLSFLTCLSLYVKCAHIFAESATNVKKRFTHWTYFYLGKNAFHFADVFFVQKKNVGKSVRVSEQSQRRARPDSQMISAETVL